MLDLFDLALDSESKKKHFYAAYSIFFIITSALCFSWFLLFGKSFIWEEDGWTQHFKALVYYSEYLRDIIRNLISEHKIIIPEWDFYIGEGTDIINALHYYVIGDPIALLSVFIPLHFMQYFYNGACVLRIFLAGISFSELCFETGITSRRGILSGAIAYCFCNWVLVHVARHPYFLNPMIYYPLMILGIEKIIQRKRPYLFIAATAVSAASNFYFFYIIVLLTVVYVFVRLFYYFRTDFRKWAFSIIRIGMMALTGVCIAGILFVPVLMMFLQDSRLSAHQPFHWFYPLSYYTRLPSIFISAEAPYWLCLGYTAPVIIAVFLLFTRRNSNRLLKALFITGIIIMIFPIGGRMLNGMSYTVNRWSWAFSLLCAYILAYFWDDFFNLQSKEWTCILLCVSVYYFACLILEEANKASVLSVFPMLYLSLIILKKEHVERYRSASQAFMILLVIIGTVNVAFWNYSPRTENIVAGTKENSKIWEEWDNNEFSVINRISELSYPRMTGRSITQNAGTFFNVSSTQYYWTISNPHLNSFRSSLYMREPLYFNFQGYDDRTTPIALAAVDYYSAKKTETAGMPYGFTLIGEFNSNPLEKIGIEELKRNLNNGTLSEEQRKKFTAASANWYSIYRNEYALPVAYCYDSYFDKQTWDSFNPVQKQEAQLESAYVDDSIHEIEFRAPDLPDYAVPYSTECNGIEITQNNSGFTTTSSNTSVNIKLKGGKENSETYVALEGLEFFPTPEYDLYSDDTTIDPLNIYNSIGWKLLSEDKRRSIRKTRLYINRILNTEITFKSSSGVSKTLYYRQPDSSFSSGRHDYIINLGYLEAPVTDITISFSKRGIYKINKLNVYCVPMEQYPAKVGKLRENTLKDITIGSDIVKGGIELSRPKLLCLAIPYSSGWEAFIDNSKVNVYCLNERYLGVAVPSGKHIILFHYHRPYETAGIFASGLGTVFLLIVIVYSELAAKTNYRKKTS